MMEPLKQFFGVFLLADDRAGFKLKVVYKCTIEIMGSATW
jgi:hypothetical protein